MVQLAQSLEKTVLDLKGTETSRVEQVTKLQEELDQSTQLVQRLRVELSTREEHYNKLQIEYTSIQENYTRLQIEITSKQESFNSSIEQEKGKYSKEIEVNFYFNFCI